MGASRERSLLKVAAFPWIDSYSLNPSAGPYTFTIGDTTGLSQYKAGGLFQQVKIPKILDFVGCLSAPSVYS